eukprot:gb/GECG01010965.1/.p1 GENE.gb/GECG01010965.1/~~gb/GECG01010965.1/.p1  ORF type:complete len:184 (+),score=7.54 gb/GECG01010965.1/:1-552(+)
MSSYLGRMRACSTNPSVYEYTWKTDWMDGITKSITVYKAARYTGDLPIDRDHLNVSRTVVTKWTCCELILPILLTPVLLLGFCIHSCIFHARVKPRHEKKCAKEFDKFNEAVCQKIYGRYQALTNTNAQGTAIGIGAAFGQQSLPNLPAPPSSNAAAQALPGQRNQFAFQQLHGQSQYGATNP